MERICGIYKITNKVNGHCYIGQSVDIKRRWRKHKSLATHEDDDTAHYTLYRAFKKYGLENFTFEVLETCSQEELNDKEVQYIEQYDSCNHGYNQNDGGNSASHTCKLTETDLDAIIRRLKTTMDGPKQIAREYGVGATTIHNINVGDAYRRDNEVYPIRPPLYHLMANAKQTGYASKPNDIYYCPICGKKKSKEGKTCFECSALSKRTVERPEPLELAKQIKELGFEEVGHRLGVSGKTISKWCVQYGIPYKKKALVAWYNEKMGITPPPRKRKISEIVRPVKQIDISTGNVLNIFANQKEAKLYFGSHDSSNHISQVCRGLRKTAFGYYWQYADEENT